MKKCFLFLLLTSSFLTIAQEKVTFKASIANRNSDALYIKNRMNVTVKEMKANPDGSFSGSFDAKEGLYQLFDGVEYGQLYLKPGFDLSLSLDAKQFDETIKFSGKGAAENNFLAEFALAEENYPYMDLLALDEATFKKKSEEKLNGDIDKLKKANFDSGFVTAMEQDLRMGMMGLNQYYAEMQKQNKLNNSQAPNFEYENHKGGKTSLESLKGKYVYIDIWATWCGPCRAEIPFLKKVEEQFHGKNIEFVSISVDVAKDYEKWKNFVTEKQLGGLQLFADKDWNSDFIKAFGINAIPRFILIDPTGKVVNASADRPSNPNLTKQLESILK